MSLARAVDMNQATVSQLGMHNMSANILVSDMKGREEQEDCEPVRATRTTTLAF